MWESRFLSELQPWKTKKMNRIVEISLIQVDKVVLWTRNKEERDEVCSWGKVNLWNAPRVKIIQWYQQAH